jgi:hypothetical protein
MVCTFKGTELLDANFKEGTINIVERHKADNGTEGLTGSGKRPIGDQIEYGHGRAIAVWCDVVADILDPVVVRNSHFFNWKVTRYFIKIEHTHSKYTKRVSRDVNQRTRISSMIVQLAL